MFTARFCCTQVAKKSLHANLTAAVILGFHSVLDSKCLGDYKHLGLNAPHVSIDLHMLRVVRGGPSHSLTMERCILSHAFYLTAPGFCEHALPGFGTRFCRLVAQH